MVFLSVYGVFVRCVGEVGRNFGFVRCVVEVVRYGVFVRCVGRGGVFSSCVLGGPLRCFCSLCVRGGPI